MMYDDDEITLHDIFESDILSMAYAKGLELTMYDIRKHKRHDGHSLQLLWISMVLYTMIEHESGGLDQYEE